MTRRPELVAFAAALDGLGANPAGDRARYLELVAPGEEPRRWDDFARMSGCALVARGILRAFVKHPLLDPPYRIGRAMADLIEIARDAGALLGPVHVPAPEPGDLVIVGGGADGGGPEHVWMATSAPVDGVIDGIDGGQKDDAGYQIIRARQHVIVDGWDQAYDDGIGSRTRRRVRWVIDGEQVLAALG